METLLVVDHFKDRMVTPMEFGLVETAIAVASGGAGCALTYKYFSDRMDQFKAEVVLMVKKNECDLRHGALDGKCAMAHSNIDRTMERLDKKFEEIKEDIRGLREDRRTELKEIIDLLKERKR